MNDAEYRLAKEPLVRRTLGTYWEVLLIGSRRRRIPPVIPMLLIIAAIVMTLFSQYLAPHSPIVASLLDRNISPVWTAAGSAEHILGTDAVGRDILSRIIHGARASVVMALVAIGIAAAVGTVLGLLAGYYRGTVDAVIMRASDLMLSLPTILIALVFAAVLGPSFRNVIIVISLLLWARFARQVRGEALTTMVHDYIALARVAGAGPIRIMRAHLLPTVANTLIVLVTYQVGWVIQLEASLSFLGVGIPPPTPTWGRMVAEGRGQIGSEWWISVFPGLCIVTLVLALNLVGDWLRDLLDPRQRNL